VTVEDVPSGIEVIKTADPTSVDEPGADVTYTFTVNNLSTVDAVTINSLTDDVLGDLNGQGDCAVPQTIPAGGSYTCQVTVFVGGDAGDVHTNVVTASGTDDDGVPVSDTDDATVTVSLVPRVEIDVEKTVSDDGQNWVEHVEVLVGADIYWRIAVDNDSNVEVDLNWTDLLDGQPLDLSTVCPDLPSSLPPGGSYTCDFGPIQAEKGQHTNIVYVQARYEDLSDVDDDDASYFGADPSLRIEKSTNGDDADDPTGPVIPVGEPVTWEFEVTNDGNVDLTNVEVTDDVLGAVCTIDALAVGETQSCQVESTAEQGQHQNLATAVGHYGDVEVSDEDPSHYFGLKPEPGAITIKKHAPNGKDHAFKFIFDGDEVFYLKDGEYKTFGDLDAGQYTVAEDTSSFPDMYWALLKVECEGNSVPVEVDHANASAKITLEAGEHIMCVFHNEQVNYEEE
jgi:hypothetical protein